MIHSDKTFIFIKNVTSTKMAFLQFYLTVGFFIMGIEAPGMGDYCKLKCTLQGNLPNIVCERNKCDLDGERCGPKATIELFKGDRVDEMLKIHNELRQKLASGSDTRGGNGKAADMNVISYHKELAFTAQCLADFCLYDHKCGRTPSFSYVGQNLYQVKRTQTTPKLDKEQIRACVTAWYDEIVDSDASLISSFKHTQKVTGHFTQLVWSKTKYVGCGAATYDKTLLIVCNYGPGGNMMRKPVYTKGEPCSKCQGGTSCNKKYNALCGEIKNDVSYKPPMGIPGFDDITASNITKLILNINIVLICVIVVFVTFF